MADRPTIVGPERLAEMESSAHRLVSEAAKLARYNRFGRLQQEERVYFIGHHPVGLIKIGLSENPVRRLGTIQAMSPVRLALLAHAPGSSAIEASLHQRFAHLRGHGEWFRPGDDLLHFIRSLAEGDNHG